MLTATEQKHLDRIELVATATDGRFAHGLRTGAPRLPREYLRRRVAVVVFVASATILAGAAVLIALGFLGAIMLLWPALLAGGWALRGPMRIRDRS